MAITWPNFFIGEADEIVRLLDNGFDRVHIRKPGSGIVETAFLLEGIPKSYRLRLSLHDHFDLAQAYGLGGIHLNSRNPIPPVGWEGLVSKSLHSIDEIEPSAHFDYDFLSPIFPSISKPGYKTQWNEEELRKNINDKIMALGGVTLDNFGYLQELGFGGAALLGSLWEKPDFKANFALQLISHPSDKFTYSQEAEMALKGGCRWVQVRHKNASYEDLTADIRATVPICRKYGATIIVDDHAELVRPFGLDGVHLGKNDMPIAEARKLVGPKKIIGATANCFADIEHAHRQGADYIGLGPFRFTSTKSNLSPVLGIEGYRSIIAQCRDAGINLPIVAIGGIVDSDIPAILDTGADGIAISSSILNAENPTQKTQSIINTIHKCQN